MPGNGLNAILARCTKVSGGTIGTDLWIAFILPVAIPVGGALIQYLELRADNAVEVLIIHILPPFMSALHGLRSLIGCG